MMAAELNALLHSHVADATEWGGWHQPQALLYDC
jgi:hypothetical protein